MSHSPEPWKFDNIKHGNCITDRNGEVVVWNTNRQYAIEREIADQDRIVACVNACRNWPTEELRGKVFGEPVTPREGVRFAVEVRPAPESVLLGDYSGVFGEDGA